MMALPKILMLGPQRTRYVECILLEAIALHLDSSAVITSAITPLTLCSQFDVANFDHYEGF